MPALVKASLNRQMVVEFGPTMMGRKACQSTMLLSRARGAPF